MKKKLIILICVILFTIISIFIFINADFHKYNKANKLLNNNDCLNAIKVFKDLNDYKDSKDKLKQSYYCYGDELIANNEIEKVYNYFSIVNDLDENDDFIKEIIYLYALDIMEENEKGSIVLLKQITDYKDVNEYILKYEYSHRFDGTYVDNDNTWTYALLPSQNKGYQYHSSNGYSNNLEEFSMQCNEDLTRCTQHNNLNNYDYEYNFNNDTLTLVVYFNKEVQDYKNGGTITKDTFNLVKKSSDINLPLEKISPKIGMTKEEVKNSTWGTPKDINKTTTSKGTKEQWVYDNYKYIYFNEDGYVTTIQE